MLGISLEPLFYRWDKGTSSRLSKLNRFQSTDSHSMNLRYVFLFH